MKIVVIGNGMVGYKFCEKLVAQDTYKKGDIELVVYGEEPSPAYDRVHLSAYFENQSQEDLLMAPRNWYSENNIQLMTGQYIVQIDPAKKMIKTHQNITNNYDYLILATGSKAMVPPIKGTEKQGVFVYRTLEDLDRIIAYAKGVNSATILGGGLLGLEAGKALIDMNLETSVVEFAPKLMPRQLDEKAAEMLKTKIEELGVSVLTNKNTSEILGDDKMVGLQFTDETSLKSDMLVISCGIKSRDELAEEAGLVKGPRGGFVVDEKMQTNIEGIFAIGEAASVDGFIYGLVAPGYKMAEIVVQQLCGLPQESFTAADMSTKLKLIGIEVGSFCDALGESEKTTPIIYEDKLAGIYKRINIDAEKNILLGGILIGDTSDYNILHQYALNEMPLPENPESLILGNRGGEDQGNQAGALPDTAQICSCEDVSKGDIIDAVKTKGCDDLEKVKSCTKAGTGCGACSPIVKDILNDTLKSMGRVVRNIICEHFDYTRQELFDLIKINNITSYDEAIKKYGKGHGCEICKPAVASILASAWNDLITKQDTIQDTNDRFLANIQKGGSYSVVPRIPGGEITPDKLIAIGQVAKTYSLYTKITGGQRIDLFGAKLNDLPAIWNELIKAGFESGHAYGKSLRTVKSCVGSTWCRYGLHDSVSFAIEVENRYKGIRSPHKLKGGVSGCRRECAEAQSKDFGIIATEEGWNLYVAGNGGANPQHAQLLAGDIDKETLVKYLDRFLMFYIKTAEPLNRTSTWLNKLDGGLDYLKDVVVNDSLGIGEQLESEMQALIDVYQCEWKSVVEDNHLKSKFKHFINSDEVDQTQSFEPFREQKVPSNWAK